MKVKVMCRKFECHKDIHYKTQTGNSCEKCNSKAFRLGIKPASSGLLDQCSTTELQKPLPKTWATTWTIYIYNTELTPVMCITSYTHNFDFHLFHTMLPSQHFNLCLVGDWPKDLSPEIYWSVVVPVLTTCSAYFGSLYCDNYTIQCRSRLLVTSKATQLIFWCLQKRHHLFSAHKPKGRRNEPMLGQVAS